MIHVIDVVKACMRSGTLQTERCPYKGIVIWNAMGYAIYGTSDRIAQGMTRTSPFAHLGSFLLRMALRPMFWLGLLRWQFAPPFFHRLVIMVENSKDNINSYIQYTKIKIWITFLLLQQGSGYTWAPDSTNVTVSTYIRGLHSRPRGSQPAHHSKVSSPSVPTAHPYAFTDLWTSQARHTPETCVVSK